LSSSSTTTSCCFSGLKSNLSSFSGIASCLGSTSISSSNEDLEKLKTTQMDTKPDSPEKEIEVEPKQEAIPEKDDRFDFKPEKQQDVVVEEDDKFCFLFWCW